MATKRTQQYSAAATGHQIEAGGCDNGTHDAYIGLGANLGEPLQALRTALAALHSAAGITVVQVSRFYGSVPIDANGPDYVNAVAQISTSLAPTALLACLQQIEAAGGRARPYRNAPRTLDLDLILYDTVQMQTAELTLPHPRMHLRAFVLQPLAELAPALIVPGLGALQDLLPTVADQTLQPIAAGLES